MQCTPGGGGVRGGVAYNACTGCLIIIKQDKLVAQQGQWHNNQTNQGKTKQGWLAGPKQIKTDLKTESSQSRIGHGPAETDEGGKFKLKCDV